VARYLPACLDSILGQPGPAGGLEVIAVDDASPDACGAILDRRAAADPRLRVIHLAERVGPGPARMRGLARAGGDFVWFADPDDALTGDCLAAIGDRLARDRPDVLLIDYLTVHPGGRAEPSHGRALLAGGAGALTLADRPDLLTRTMTVWSKVISRPFLAGLGIGFPPGIHEDVAVSCVVLLCAARIALLDRVCYLYRRRAGAFLATPGTAHFGIFGAYERVFEFTAAAETAGPVAAAVFSRAVEHYSSILASGLVPRRARREFFGRMAADFRRYRPPGYRRPAGLRGLRVRLIERNSYRLYALLGPVNAARVRLRGALRQAGRAAKSLPDHMREK
jgi:CDP-glycerol glycerophosphotransferase